MFDFTKFPKLNSLDTATVDKAIDDIIKAYSGAEQRELFHVRLIAIVEFCNYHKDGSRLDKLWNDMPLTINVKGVANWLSEYTGWEIRENKKGVKKFLSRDDEDNTVFWLDETGLTMPFYDMPKTKKQKDDVWDFDKKLDALLSKALAMSKDKKVEMDDETREEIRWMMNARIEYKNHIKVKNGELEAMLRQAEEKAKAEEGIEEQVNAEVDDNTSNLVQLNAA